MHSKLVKESCTCDICKKNRSKVYFCKWPNCVHSNRMLCKKCGIFTHDADDEDDKDNTQHEFDLTSNYIEEVSFNKLLTKKQRLMSEQSVMTKDIIKLIDEKNKLIHSLKQENKINEQKK
eukprot:51061_1